MYNNLVQINVDEIQLDANKSVGTVQTRDCIFSHDLINRFREKSRIYKNNHYNL